MPHISTYGGSYFSTKPNRNKLEADGFMRIGDIKGEVVSTDRDDRSDQVGGGATASTVKPQISRRWMGYALEAQVTLANRVTQKLSGHT